MKVKFKIWDCVAMPLRYGNGRKAIELVDHITSEPIAVATVNIVDQESTSWNHVFIKDYSENEGMEYALYKAGIITEVYSKAVTTGFIVVNEFELTDEAIKMWEPRKYEEEQS